MSEFELVLTGKVTYVENGQIMIQSLKSRVIYPAWVGNSRKARIVDGKFTSEGRGKHRYRTFVEDDPVIFLLVLVYGRFKVKRFSHEGSLACD